MAVFSITGLRDGEPTEGVGRISPSTRLVSGS
jgi:hypothetical protein